jgi:DNA-binding GntR family transcriptional regulator
MPENYEFPELTTESLCEKVVASLKESFFSGHLKPGDMIIERQIAKQMKIGTPAVREALVTLQEQGFVQKIANTATYVSKFSMDEVRQLYALRIEFELLALRWAKSVVTESDLAALEKIVEQMVDAGVQRNAKRFFECDLQFHRQCWKLARNKYLTRSLEDLVPPLFAFVLNASAETVHESIARQHLQIVDALRSIPEPEFTNRIREALSNFALIGIASMIPQGTSNRAPA